MPQQSSSKGWRGLFVSSREEEKGGKKERGGREGGRERRGEEKERWRPITGERVSRNCLKRI